MALKELSLNVFTPSRHPTLLPIVPIVPNSCGVLMPLESSRNALSWSHERPFNVSNNWLRLKMRTIRAQKWERFHNCPRANKCKSFEGRRNTPVTSLALSQMWLSVSSAVINLKPFGNSIWWHSCARIVETHENYQGAICDWLMQ